MERLTKIDGLDNAEFVCCFNCNPGHNNEKCGMCERQYEACNKLANYEDSGLTPGQVAELTKENIPAAIEKLVEYESLIPIETAREWVKAHEDGRLVVLPCKAGDRIFDVIADDLDGEFISNDCFLGEYGFERRTIVDDVFDCFIPLREINKTVFLTREEAEVALKIYKTTYESEANS
jgi:hypothetical protein